MSTSGDPPPPPRWGPRPQPPQQPRQSQPQVRNGLGTAALVLGIIGVLCGLVPILFWAAGILAVPALVLGSLGIGRARTGQATNRGTAIWGTSLGAVAAILAVIGLVISVSIIDDAVDDLDGTGGKKETSSTAPGEPGDRRAGKDSDNSGDSGDSDGLRFGETFTYDDGVKVTVAPPVSYRPSTYALGHSEGDKARTVKITVVNGTDRAVDLDLTNVTFKDADGAEAEKIFGDGLPRELAGNLLPGKEAVATYAVSLPADAATTLEVQVEPGFLRYDSATWAGSSG
ncbi:DUF4190 domain-containing protein [Streptomyces sp. G44]|uniref:DUF4190 domain-containing protein n=1 Tax=Streptomyces sp. G44 TaxID=2807632 RepID=UPI00196219FB|nr:DUF4190 domain-containing protein [Streptomyces sp. G44]MBM7173672.1 DUF4190 domain-containing protein [Streptomyces sp. G44]